MGEKEEHNANVNPNELHQPNERMPEEEKLPQPEEEKETVEQIPTNTGITQNIENENNEEQAQNQPNEKIENENKEEMNKKPKKKKKKRDPVDPPTTYSLAHIVDLAKIPSSNPEKNSPHPTPQSIKLFTDEYAYLDYQELKDRDNIKIIEEMKEDLIVVLDKGLYEVRKLCKEVYKLAGNKKVNGNKFTGKSRTFARRFTIERLKEILVPMTPVLIHFKQIHFLQDFNDFFDKIINKGLNIDSDTRKKIAAVREYDELAEVLQLTKKEIVQFETWMNDVSKNMYELKLNSVRFMFPKWNTKIESAVEMDRDIPLSELSESTQEELEIEPTELENQEEKDIQKEENQKKDPQEENLNPITEFKEKEKEPEKEMIENKNEIE